MGEKYPEVIAEFDDPIATHLKTLQRQSALPPLPPKQRVRGRKPHDPRFDVRTALYLATGVDRTAIAGSDESHALTRVSALGSDFTKWPTVKPFSSWLGLCPNFQKTGGKVKSSRTRRGKGRAAHALRLAAGSLLGSKGALGAYLRRQRSRLGAPKAITATAPKLGRIVYHRMRFGEAYVKRTEEAYAQEVRERQERQLHRRARELGFEVKRLEPQAEAASAVCEGTGRGSVRGRLGRVKRVDKNEDRGGPWPAVRADSLKAIRRSSHPEEVPGAACFDSATNSAHDARSDSSPSGSSRSQADNSAAASAGRPNSNSTRARDSRMLSVGRSCADAIPAARR